MRIDRDIAIPISDGLVLRADVFRPGGVGRFPALLSYGPYAKGLAFEDGYPIQWAKLVSEHPDVLAHSSGLYQCWEVADPEVWVPDGYVVVRVDSRGTGCSPGYIDIFSPRESQDLYECIEWLAGQEWCDGKIGLSGVSYYAINQWLVAGLKPPHLVAMVPWEGGADFYRDWSYHGGILSEFGCRWYPLQVATVQHGLGSRAAKSRMTGESVTGELTLSDAELVENRADHCADLHSRPLDGAWYRDRSADWSKVTVPFLSAANWGGQGLHSRGNFEAFVEAASESKWLEVHGQEHWTSYYTDYGVRLQKRFFEHFLKGADNGWHKEPRVRLQVRTVDGFFERHETEWPIARTHWTAMYLCLNPPGLARSPMKADAYVEYSALGDGVTFATAPLTEDIEITGPAAAHLFISSETADADVFLILRLLAPDGREVVFRGALDPNTPVAQGWLRASHRRLDPIRSLPYRPFHTHDRVEPLVPGEIYPLDVEIWPTSVVIPAGHRLALTARGRDYEFDGDVGDFARRFHFASRGCGPFLHNDPEGRPADVFGGRVRIYCGPAYDSHILLPLIPGNSAQ